MCAVGVGLVVSGTSREFTQDEFSRSFGTRTFWWWEQLPTQWHNSCLLSTVQGISGAASQSRQHGHAAALSYSALHQTPLVAIYANRQTL
jgi:hypothetical protein